MHATHRIHFDFWHKDHFEALKQAKTPKHLLPIALGVAERRPRGVQMIAGAITTGGIGTIEGNLTIFERMIEYHVTEKKENTFSQLPFEDVLRDYMARWTKHGNGGYCDPIIDDLYLPFLRSGLIVRVCFIYGWRTSIGARREHEICKERGIEIIYLPKSLNNKVLEIPARDEDD